MNNKALSMSLFMAVIAVFFVQSYVSSIEEDARKKFGTEILVIKAKKDIKEMDTLNETMLTLERIPKRFLEPASLSFEKREEKDAEVTKTLRNLAGMVAIVPIRAGEQITLNKLTQPNIRTGLAPQVAPGRRAVSVRVDDMSAVGKLVKPGDRVDLIAILDTGVGKEARLAKTILQDIVVLAVGRSVTNNVPRMIEADPISGKDRVRSLAEDFSFNTVTLEVEPHQAQAVALITANGESSLSLSLRNNDDTERVNMPALSLWDVLGADAARIRVPQGRR